MRQAQLLITADWHVRKYDRVWYRRPELSGDTQYGISQVVAMAKQLEVPVLLLGDVFEQKLQQSDALSVMWSAIEALRRCDLRIYYVQGQHELSQPPLLNAIHDWPIHIHGRAIMCGGRKIYGLDYRPAGAVVESLRGVPSDAMLATHQVWKNFMGEDRGDAWFADTPATTILTGDFHHMMISQYGAQTVISPGPICMQAINEPSRKYVIVLYADGTYEPVQLQSRGCYAVHLDTAEELVKFADTWPDAAARTPQFGVPAPIATNILIVRYAPWIPDALPTLEKVVGTSAHLFAMPLPQAAPQQLHAAACAEAVLAGGFEGCLRTHYPDEDPAVIDNAIRLYRTNDVETTIADIFRELQACQSA